MRVFLARNELPVQAMLRLGCPACAAELSTGLGRCGSVRYWNSAGRLDSVRVVPQPGVRRCGGPGYTFWQRLAGPAAATDSQPACGRHVTFGMHNVVPGARSSAG